MNLARRLRGESRSTFPTFSVDDYLAALSEFTFNGTAYPLGLTTTYGRFTTEEYTDDLGPHMAAIRQSPPAFGAQLVRANVLSQARFTFRDRSTRAKYTGAGLGILQNPWPNGTTVELLSRMEWCAGPAGNAFVFRDRANRRLRVLRPDWVTVVYGSDRAPEEGAWALDARLLGYTYRPAPDAPTYSLDVRDVAHWAPIPDPLSPAVGMSWITPVIREVQGDISATKHKLKFFENGATPNLVVSGIPAATREQFDDVVAAMEQSHSGLRNAYRTLYLTAGADATVVGANLKDLDLKGLQGGHETRIAVASRVPAPVLGISEGLAGSSLNAGNYGQARRNFSDGWVVPSLMDLCGSLQSIVDVPNDATELWFDLSDMAFMREDAKDAAEIEGVKATTIRQLVDGGFVPETVIAAVQAQDMSLLKHSGLTSVQLTPPGVNAP